MSQASSEYRLKSVRLLLLGLAIGAFTIGVTEFAAMSLVPYFSAELGVDQARAADAISAYAVGVLVGAPLLTLVSVRFSRRRVLMLLMAGIALFNLLSALAPTFETFVAARFLAGLPHGAYFGVAALTASAAVPANKKSQAISRIMLGLTIATIIGVPIANLVGQTIGWRFCYFAVVVLALITVAAIWQYAPRGTKDYNARSLSELKALQNRQVLMTLATCAIGFGGMFAVYTYIASVMGTEMTVSASMTPLALAVFGIGMTTGALLVGVISARFQTQAIFGFFAVMLLALLCYPSATAHFPAYLLDIFVLGSGGGVTALLQTRLIDVTRHGQRLAQALNQSAFNLANALGPWVAALFIHAGFGYRTSGYVGAGLTGAGVLMFIWTVLDYHRHRDQYQMEEG